LNDWVELKMKRWVSQILILNKERKIEKDTLKKNMKRQGCEKDITLFSTCYVAVEEKHKKKQEKTTQS